MSKDKDILANVSLLYTHSGDIISEEHETEKVSVVKLQDDVPYCQVSTQRGTSVNLGDFNNAKASVSISVPAVFDDKEIERAYTFAANFCESRIAEINSKLKRK